MIVYPMIGGKIYKNFIYAPKSGTINNIVIFIRFSDDSEFTNKLSYFDDMFNNNTVSMTKYFEEASYGKLSIHSTFYPATTGTTVVSYQDSNARSYYQPKKDKDGNIVNPNGYEGSEGGQREGDLLKNAVNSISGQVDSSLVIDGDNDGRVDNVCFIVKGNPSGWGDLLWPHQGGLAWQNVSINGKKVDIYNLQLEKYIFVGVLCHEMCHSVGLPDLYHYKDSDSDPNNNTGISPVGPWDLMDGTASTPQHMCAYMKYKYGTWIAGIPEASGKGPFTLNSLDNPTGNCYKIASPAPSDEFFVVEYRRRTGNFESSLPGSGLIIYRINPKETGNADGPPNEVFACRPGVSSSNPNGNGPGMANLSRESGRTTLGGDSNPILLSDGTDSKLKIIIVSSAEDKISFEIADTSERADLSITQASLTNPAYVDKPLRFNISALNSGPNTAKNVIIEAYVSGIDISIISVAKGAWIFTNGGYIRGVIDELASSESITATVDGIATELKFTSNASIKNDLTDPNALNNTNFFEMDVIEETDVSLVKKSSKDIAYKNEIIEYELTVKNSGPSTALNMEVTDYLPQGAEYLSISSDKPAHVAYSNDSEKVIIFIDELKDQEEIKIKVKVLIKELRKLVNTAAVTSKTKDPDLSNNTASSTVNVIVKLSAGPQLRDGIFDKLDVLLENKLPETVEVTLYLKDLEKPLNTKIKNITIKPDFTECISLIHIPKMYEIVVDKVPDGVYLFAASGNHPRFNHGDFIIVDIT